MWHHALVVDQRRYNEINARKLSLRILWFQVIHRNVGVPHITLYDGWISHFRLSTALNLLSFDINSRAILQKLSNSLINQIISFLFICDRTNQQSAQLANFRLYSSHSLQVVGPKYMENRKPFNLRYILIAYNFIQVIFSTWLFYEVSSSIFNLNNFIRSSIFIPYGMLEEIDFRERNIQRFRYLYSSVDS